MDLIFNVVYNLTKGLLFFIDNIVYSFIPILYKLLLYLANVDLLTNNVPIQSLVKRIYILVGVFMLFRLSFSIVNYIIYPESFSDQSKGFSNLVKRSLLALVLLVGIPWFFTMAYFVQGKIISSNIIPRLILGNGGAVDQKLEDSIETSAVDLQFLVFGPFFSLNYNSSGSGGSSGDLSSGDLAICKPTEEAPMLNIIGSSDMASNKSGCLTQVARLMDNDPTVKSSHVTIENFFRSSDEQGNVVDYRRFKAFGGLLSWTLSDGEFAIKYYPIVSTICGGYLVLLLISFCIDVAARAIKLLFLQILSPIAVISSLDPTSSGDRLKEWWKECLTIWASLFIRLIVIFLIIQLTRVISNSIYNGNLISTSGLNGTKGMIGWLYLFLILGIFTAAKKIPDLIEKATGMKMSGDLELNPLKTLQSNPGVTGLTGATLGLAAGGVAGSFAAYSTARANDHSALRSLGSAAGALFTGGATGLARGARAGGIKGFNAGLQSGGRISRRMDVREAIGGWRNTPKMFFERARDFVGASTTFESVEAHAKRYDDVGKSIDDIQNYIVGELGKKDDGWKTIQANRTRYEQAFKDGTEMDAGVRDSVQGALDSARKRKIRELNGLNMSDFKTAREYQKKVADLNADIARIDSMTESTWRTGVLSDQAYVALQNEMFSQEQDAIADFYNSNHETGELAMLESAARKASRDAKIDGEFPSDWYDIGGAGNKGSLKSRSKDAAVAIRSKDSYNDYRDLDQAIHSARTDSHQKFH